MSQPNTDQVTLPPWFFLFRNALTDQLCHTSQSWPGWQHWGFVAQVMDRMIDIAPDLYKRDPV